MSQEKSKTMPMQKMCIMGFVQVVNVRFPKGLRRCLEKLEISFSFRFFPSQAVLLVMISCNISSSGRVPAFVTLNNVCLHCVIRES